MKLYMNLSKYSLLGFIYGPDVLSKTTCRRWRKRWTETNGKNLDLTQPSISLIQTILYYRHLYTTDIFIIFLLWYCYLIYFSWIKIPNKETLNFDDSAVISSCILCVRMYVSLILVPISLKFTIRSKNDTFGNDIVESGTNQNFLSLFFSSF